MNPAVLNFVASSLSADDVRGRSVLEVGAADFNGTPRSVLERHEPAKYMGVDLYPGKGVDLVVGVSFLVDRFGPESFDVVVSTEMLEHVQDWRWAVSQLKRVTGPGGRLLVTTRSPGFYYHGYPHDFWRFTEADFAHIFSDFEDVHVEPDPSSPGVFVCARRPRQFVETDLTGYEVATRPEPPLGPLLAHVKVTAGRRIKRLVRRVRGQ